MLKIGNLRMSLCRHCAVPTLPHTSLVRRLPGRIRIPLVTWRTNSSTSSSSKLMVSGELEDFPLGESDFRQVRHPGFAYFDKTSHIAKLEKGPGVKLVCRPRRFGKSLTVTTLRYFHGFQFRNEYDGLFKDLDVDNDVKNGIVQPGQYLVVEFDFSRIIRAPDMDESVEALVEEINHGLSRFMINYSKHLGDLFTSDISALKEGTPAGNLTRLIAEVDHALNHIHESGDKGHALWGVKGIYLLADEYDAYANEYMDPHNPRPWSDAKPFQVLKSFWSSVKAGRKLTYGIRKAYITGITPLLLSDLVSGANDQENISFNPDISTICGLTRSDVLGALQVTCNDDEEVQTHLQTLQHYANGYHFCQEERVQPVFNTQTALSYLQALKRGRKPNIENPPNSEVSERFLQACAHAPAAVKDMQSALQMDEHGAFRKIACDPLLLSLTLPQLHIQASGENDISAWRSLMVYMGGLTPDSDDPSKFLKIPNLVAAKRFGSAILDRYGLRDSMKSALYDLAATGNPMGVLAGYCRLIRQRDIKGNAFLKSEEQHRDSISVTILENPAIKPAVEYEVKKRSKMQGFIDLLITDNKNHYSLIEFKNIPVRYLGLSGENDEDKAEQLAPMGLSKILNLKFKGCNYRSGTIRNWIDGQRKTRNNPKTGEVRDQLQSYIAGPTVQKEIAGKEFRGWIAVVVGSRHILVREMDRHGDWVSEFQLAQ